MADDQRITFSGEAVRALDELITGMVGAANVLQKEGETLYSCMHSVKEDVGPFADDYETEIKKIITKELDLLKRLSNMARYAAETRDYISNVLAGGGSGNP